MIRPTIAIAAAILCVGATPPAPRIEPIRLKAGVNHIADIAGDGHAGAIELRWRENGNAWGYDIFTVTVNGSIATVEGRDNITDSPHTGDDMVTSVRFVRGAAEGHRTTFILTASRNIVGPVPDPAPTVLRIYVLQRSRDALGTPYEFRLVREFSARRRYCNADMALQSEIGLPVARSYSGPVTIDGCPR
jgi:hypothetical protein